MIYASTQESTAGEVAREAPPPHPPAPRPGLLARGLAGAVHLSLTAVQFPVRAVRPLVMSETLRPARDVADAALRRIVDAFASMIAEQLQYNLEAQDLVELFTDRVLKDLGTRERTAALVQVQMQSAIAFLAADPSVTRPLVEAAAGDYLVRLAQNPTALRPLVHQAAGDYVAHLTAQPETVDALVEAVAANFMATLRERPLLADGLVRTLADRYVGTLAERPEALAPLVERVAGAYVETLQQHPEQLDALVQAVGDRYLEHLHANPGNVQELLTNQSATLATEIIEEARERSTTIDAMLEGVARRLLRKQPRTELAPAYTASPHPTQPNAGWDP